MKVLLAVDGSPHSQAAIAEVASRSWPERTAVEILTVIHAAAPLVFDPAFVMAPVHVEQLEEQRQRASAIVDSASEQIRRSRPGIVVTSKILEGIPRNAIVEEAAEWSADLIVLGSHGYGRIRRMLLGSVAGAVVANAPCSVEVVRTAHIGDATESAA
jgi:nucleotide-binding universal stress UspA family protein